MISALVSLIILFVFLGLVFWAIQQLLPLVPLAEPFRTLVRVCIVLIVAIIAIYFILQLLAVAGVPVGMPHWGRLP